MFIQSIFTRHPHLALGQSLHHQSHIYPLISSDWTLIIILLRSIHDVAEAGCHLPQNEQNNNNNNNNNNKTNKCIGHLGTDGHRHFIRSFTHIHALLRSIHDAAEVGYQ